MPGASTHPPLALMGPLHVTEKGDVGIGGCVKVQAALGWECLELPPSVRRFLPAPEAAERTPACREDDGGGCDEEDERWRVDAGHPSATRPGPPKAKMRRTTREEPGARVSITGRAPRSDPPRPSASSSSDEEHGRG